MRNSIPRIVIAGTQSGSGKTTLVTGLLAALRARELSVQSYKVGPDYIDPGFHALASGRPAHNLDTWLVPAAKLPALFLAEAGDADIAVIEGVMGLYDGGRKGVSSTAEIAKLLDAPVLLTIDCKSMGASAAAIALGFKSYDPDVNIAGVLLNRLGSATHETMIRTAMEAISMPVLGAIHRDDALHLPERHLGLTPTTEVEAAETVRKMGEAVGRQVDVEGIVALAKKAVTFENPDASLPSQSSLRMTAPPEGEPLAHPLRLAVAQDAAFSFYYESSLAVLERLGATLVPFSPLKDAALPDGISGLLIGGGFPEMFASDLAANATMRQSIREAADADLPIYAECGGYMYLLEDLVDFDGKAHPMCGVFPGRAAMTKKLQMVGYVTAKMQWDTILGPAGTELRGHEFHFSQELEREEPVRPYTFTKLRNGATYGAGQQRGNVLGSYLHIHFAGCPGAAGHFVEACQAYGKKADQ
ncbi:cobyrinate a,c-diamide synthase [uncultured Selenomonas sp.]|uniref:cobyrinate a,c-diamide synthase n=1 Tax=uncultured Selenomonas sp. TaxID=159275 RepID=UPI0025D07008|nr:cobyrinate a,c-diamide synthase [uncultured Selenomonas sp.]